MVSNNAGKNHIAHKGVMNNLVFIFLLTIDAQLNCNVTRHPRFNYILNAFIKTIDLNLNRLRSVSPNNKLFGDTVSLNKFFQY